jgi:hypothetical protein
VLLEKTEAFCQALAKRGQEGQRYPSSKGVGNRDRDGFGMDRLGGACGQNARENRPGAGRPPKKP